MFLVGLTGGIASGKSTVAELWQSLGATVIDADELARQVVALGSPGLEQVSKRFGMQVINADGTLDRKALGSLVFQDAGARKDLENILHPMIQELSKQRISSASGIVVYMIPLLVETQSDLPFDFVVTVEAPESEQIHRLVTSRGLSEDEAILRVKSQASPVERANRSNEILNSNQSLELLLADAKACYFRIERKAHLKESANV